jgi:hypothetical protein
MSGRVRRGKEEIQEALIILTENKLEWFAEKFTFSCM